MPTEQLSKTILASYEDLKRNAKKDTDIENWFTNHIELFGELPNHKEGTLEVRVDFSLGVTSFLTSVDDNYQYRCNVRVELQANPLEDSPITQLIGMSALQNNRSVSYTSSFKMPFEEWAYPVMDVAFDYMANDCYSMNVTTEWAERAEKCINTYLPLHFPGLTVEKLKSFAGLGLFIIDEKANTDTNYLQYDREQFINILFKSREGAVELSKTVPDTMSL